MIRQPRIRSGQPEPVHAVTTRHGDDGHVDQHVVAGGQEGRAAQRAAVVADPGQQPRARAVDDDRAERDHHERHDVGDDRVGEALHRLPPGHRGGPRMISAIALPMAARRASGQPRARKISRLIEVSSRKSTLSASSETDPAASATENSTKK